MVKRIIGTLIVLGVLITGGVFVARSLSAGTGKEKTQYRIAEVKSDTVKKTVTATGILKPWTVVDIKSRAGGRIDQLVVEEGTEVKKGALIAQIDPSDTLLSYNTAKADIDSNRARVDETTKMLALQRQQSRIAVETAEANLRAANASALSSKARMESAQKQSLAQEDLTSATISNVNSTLAAEKARLQMMKEASHPQEVAQARAQKDQAEANLTNAQAQLNRRKMLLEKGFASQSEVDQAQATYDVARANVLSSREKVRTIESEQLNDLKAQEARVAQVEAQLRSAEAGRVDIATRKQSANAAEADYQAALAQVKQSEARLLQSKAELSNIGIREAQLKQTEASGARARASLANAQVQLDQTKVTAPSDGVILKKYVEQGTIITSGMSFNSAGTSIVQLGTTERMYVDVQVDETDVANVDLEQKVDITFDAYSTTPFEGKVIKIDPQAVIESNVTTVHVRVEVDNSSPTFRLLKPGLNATCEFIINKKENVVAIPNEALKTDSQDKKYVEVPEGGKVAPVEKGNESDPNMKIEVKVVKRPIEIGLEGNDMTEVTGGIKEGDKIITQTLEPTPIATGAGANPFRASGPGPGRR